MDFFETVGGVGGAKRFEIRYTYSKMIKLGTVIDTFGYRKL